jgi:hypothetical protein
MALGSTQPLTEMFVGNSSVNTAQHSTTDEAVFSMWSATRNSISAEFSVRGPCREDIRVRFSGGRIPPP